MTFDGSRPESERLSTHAMTPEDLYTIAMTAKSLAHGRVRDAVIASGRFTDDALTRLLAPAAPLWTLLRGVSRWRSSCWRPEVEPLIKTLGTEHPVARFLQQPYDIAVARFLAYDIAVALDA